MDFGALEHLVGEMVFITDADRTITYVSPSVERVLGYTVEEFVGVWTANIIHPDDLTRVAVESLSIRERPGATYHTEVRLRHADGRWVWVETAGKNLLDDPDVRGVVSTMRDVSRSTELEEQLAHEAAHDHLTQLHNRSSFLMSLSTALNRADGPVAVLFFDLDRFKLINDSLGHAAGDELLTVVAGRLTDAASELARSLDPDSDALDPVGVGRFGGDEFVARFPVVDEADAARKAEFVRSRVAGPANVHGEVVHIAVSVGVAIGDERDLGASLVRDADIALYAAKRAGRGHVRLFDAGLRRAAVERLELEQELHEALERDELEVRFRPIVELGSGACVGATAALVWHHPRRGLLDADRFVPVAEESGLTSEIGRLVLDRACRDAAAWTTADTAPTVQVTLSERQLADSQLVDRVRSALAHTGVAPDRLRVALPEPVLARHTQVAEVVVDGLAELGVGIAVADFEAGPAALAQLRRLPVGAVEIDPSLVAMVGTDEMTDVITRALVEVADLAGARTIAVGVSSEAQAQRLRELGCHLGVGDAFGGPTTADDLARRL